MKDNTVSIVFAAVIVFLFSGLASADEVWLRNGDRLTGRVVSLKEAMLLFNTAYAGDISIRWEDVVNLKTENPIAVVLGDDTTFHGPVLAGEGGRISVEAEKLDEPVAVDLANVTAINPDPPGPAMNINFRANLGAGFATGNTDKKDIYADSEFIARTERNRYTIGGLYRRAESDNVRTEAKSLGHMKYDHFLTEKWYAYANTSAERDRFKDLDLRYSLGLGAGYQFFESDRTNLSVEGGISYVKEDHTIAEDNSFAAGRWGLRFDHFLVSEFIQYFLDHTGLQSFEESDDLVLLTRTGFRVPFYRNLNFTAQVNWDYDRSPAPGIKRGDYTYIFSIGYQWAR